MNKFTVLRTYRATDVCGNSATCTQLITVNDNTPPQITCPVPVTVQCAADVPQPNLALVTATDNCAGTVTKTFVSDVTTPGTCVNKFTVLRTYRATDVCGNSATCTQLITVNDNTLPSITCPAPVTVQCAADVPAVNIGSVVATDNCAGTVTVTHVGDVISAQTVREQIHHHADLPRDGCVRQLGHVHADDHGQRQHASADNLSAGRDRAVRGGCAGSEHRTGVGDRQLRRNGDGDLRERRDHTGQRVRTSSPSCGPTARRTCAATRPRARS